MDAGVAAHAAALEAVSDDAPEAAFAAARLEGCRACDKIVAAASDAMIVIADSSKIVDALGRFPLPIEVNRFGLGATRHAVAAIMKHHNAQGELKLRASGNGEPFLTDGGHLILDAFFGRISQPEALSNELLDIPGVVQHGLFLKMCRKAYVATPNGVETLLKGN